MKKTLLLLGVALAPVLVVKLVLASGDWRAVGQTLAGDKVSVSAVRVLKAGQRTALVRVQYKEPTELPQVGSSQGGSSQVGSSQGGPFVEMRAFVRLHCADGAAPMATEWFYSRERNGRIVVSRKITHDEQFGQAPEGGFAQMVSDSVCGQSK